MIGFVYPFVIFAPLLMWELYLTHVYASLQEGEFILNFGLYVALPALLTANVLIRVGNSNSQGISSPFVASDAPNAFMTSLGERQAMTDAPAANQPHPAERACCIGANSSAPGSDVKSSYD